MDASRQVVRGGKAIFPRVGKLMQEFADHLASDVKQLVEDEETGAKAYRYVRTGTNHYSLAFTYDCIAWSRESLESVACFGYDEDEHMGNDIRTMDL